MDCHAFSLNNAVYQRLVTMIRERQEWRKSFTQPGKYQVYTTVADAENQLLGAELQGWSSFFQDDVPYNERQNTANVFNTAYNAAAKRFNLTEEAADTWWLCIESASSLWFQLKSADSWQAVYHAVGQFVRAVTGKPLLKAMSIVCDRLKELIQSVIDYVQGDEPFLQGEDDQNPFSKLRSWLAKAEELKTHPIVVKIKKIFYYVMSFSLLERFGIKFNTFWFSKAEEELIRSQHGSKLGFVASLVEGTSFILERLYDCFKTGTWNAIIHSGHSYGKWVDEVYLIKEQSQMMHNPEANGIKYHEFLGRLSNALEKGEAICKFAEGLDVGTKTMLKRLLSELRLIKANECTKKAARETRHAPFSVLYYGGSGIGKSTLQKLTYQYYGRLHGLPTGPEYHYTRSFADEYWSGFQTSMWSIVLDDVASRNPNLGDDPSMTEVLQIINNVPYTPPQADLADKGKTPLRPELVQGTTNTKNLHAHAYYACPLAVQRRFPIVVTPFVKAEYCKQDAGGVPSAVERMLDSSRCPPLQPGEYPDYWYFQVETVKAERNSQGQVSAVYRNALDKEYINSIDEFLAFIGRMSLEHKRNQDAVEASEQAFATATICPTCLYRESLCKCDVELQSSELSLTSVVYHGFVLYFLHYLWTLLTPPRVRWWQSWKLQIEAEIGRRAVKHCFSQAIAGRQTAQHSMPGVGKDLPQDPLEDIRQRTNVSLLTDGERLQMEHHEVRGILVRAGDTMRKSWISNPAILGFITVVPTIIVAVGAYQMWRAPKTQGSKDEGVRLSTKDEKPNPWYRDEYEPSVLDVGRSALSMKGLERKTVIDIVQRNTVYAVARYTRENGQKQRVLRALCVGGNLYVTNSHNLPKYDLTLSITLGRRDGGVGENFEFFIGKDDTFRIEERDLVFFRVGCAPPKSDLSGLLTRKAFQTVCNGSLLHRNEQGESECWELRGINAVVQRVPELDRNMESWAAKVEKNTTSGMCGSAMLGYAPCGPVLLGLHQTGGRFNECTAVKLYIEDVEAAKNAFKQPIIQCGAPNLKDKFDAEIQLQPLHAKSVFRYMETGTASVYGSLPGFRTKHQSKVRDTILRPAMEARGYTTNVGAPKMHGWEPWRIAAHDIVQQPFLIRQSMLDECVAAFAQDITSVLPSAALDEIVVLDNASTLNGSPGVKFIDKMNRKTSMGFPWREKKRNFMNFIGQHEEWNDYVEFDDFFYDRVDEIIKKYENCERAMPVFTGHLKDEPLKRSKIESGATRAFSGGPADWCFVVRKYTLALVRQMQLNKFVFETAPGTNATSLDWCNIYHYLTQHGRDRMVAGDYSKFDKRMSAQMILAAFRVIDEVLKCAGWDERDRNIVQCIGYDTAFPLTDFNGDLVQFWGSNPSGHPLTVIINGIVNSLYIRYVWRLVGNDLSLFKSQVALMTYGDDNIMGVSRYVTNFDHTVLVKGLATIGVVYTMADKEAESVPFIHIDNCSFLKRAWRYEPELGSCVAQIEHASIAKMLMVHIPSRVVCAEEQAMETMQTALCEYFLYGRKVFDEKREMFLSVVAEMDLHDFYRREFPTFDELKNRYLEASKEFSEDGQCHELH